MTPETPKKVQSQVELARLLGVTRQTIARRRRDKGNPGVSPNGAYDVEAWRAYLTQVGAVNGDGDEDDPKRQNLRLKNEKLAAQIEILRGEWMPIPEVEKMGGELGSAVRKVVCQLHMIAPHVVGMTIPEAEKYLKEKEDEILGQLHLIEPETIKRRAKTAIENKK